MSSFPASHRSARPARTVAVDPGGAPGLLVTAHAAAGSRREVLHVRGELDMATAPLLSRELDRAGAGRGDVLLDVSALTFCDVVGLTAVERAGQRLSARGCRLSLRGAEGPLRLLLRVPGLFGTPATAAPDATAGPAPDPARRAAHRRNAISEGAG